MAPEDTQFLGRKATTKDTRPNKLHMSLPSVRERGESLIGSVERVPLNECRHTQSEQKSFNADTDIWTKLYLEEIGKKKLRHEILRIERMLGVDDSFQDQPIESRISHIRLLVEKHKNETLKPALNLATPTQISEVKTVKQESNANISKPLLKRPVWCPDHTVVKCKSCPTTFSFFIRRHHCRACGDIFCYRCSQSRVPIPTLLLHKPVRVCTACLPTVALSLETCDNVEGELGDTTVSLLAPCQPKRKSEDALDPVTLKPSRRSSMEKEATNLKSSIPVPPPLPTYNLWDPPSSVSKCGLPETNSELRMPASKGGASQPVANLPFLNDIRTAQRNTLTLKKANMKDGHTSLRPSVVENLHAQIKHLRKTPTKVRSDRSFPPRTFGNVDLQQQLSRLKKTPSKSQRDCNPKLTTLTPGAALKNELMASLRKVRQSVTGGSVEQWEKGFEVQKRKVLMAQSNNQVNQLIGNNASPTIKTVRGLNNFLNHREMIKAKENVNSPARSDFSDFVSSPASLNCES